MLCWLECVSIFLNIVSLSPTSYGEMLLLSFTLYMKLLILSLTLYSEDVLICSLVILSSFLGKAKKQSQAEVHFILQHKGLVIPVEVKSGASGRL